jgi:hypothetical protein
MSTMTHRRPTRPQEDARVTTLPHQELLDWEAFGASLSWLERIRTLLESSGGWSAENQAVINALASALLQATAGVGPSHVPSPEDGPVIVQQPTRARPDLSDAPTNPNGYQ